MGPDPETGLPACVEAPLGPREAARGAGFIGVRWGRGAARKRPRIASIGTDRYSAFVIPTTFSEANADVVRIQVQVLHLRFY